VTKPLTVRKKIMVIDDDPAIRDVLRIILEQAAYEVDTSEDGNEILKNNFSKPDLFLIDRLLSGTDGLELCRHLKHDESTKNIPVVMISAAPGIDGLSRHAGADDYVEKPFDRAYLLRVVQSNISESEIGQRKDTPGHFLRT
jgi:DNA-binding response OmpR family regulator